MLELPGVAANTTRNATPANSSLFSKLWGVKGGLRVGGRKALGDLGELVGLGGMFKLVVD